MPAMQRLNLGLPYGAAIFDGQRFFTPTGDAFDPVAVGPVAAVVPAPIPAATPMNSGPALNSGTVVGGPAGSTGFLGGKLNVALPLILILGVALLVLHAVHFRE